MKLYDPLEHHLAKQTPNVREVPMTFKKIENILGHALPYSARHRNQWWANNPQRHVQAHAWLGAGYMTEGLDLVTQTVTFAR